MMRTFGETKLLAAVLLVLPILTVVGLSELENSAAGPNATLPLCVSGDFACPSNDPATQNRANWDSPAAPRTPEHDEVVRRQQLLDDFLDLGRQLFRAKFNTLDGAGRPESTGDSKPTIRLGGNARAFQRLAGPDANSCAACHNDPFVGGAGDFALNVFVGAHFTDPPTNRMDAEITNERNTISVFGSGAIETVAREMTDDLTAQRNEGIIRARAEGRAILVQLTTKGISFGSLVAQPNGTFDPQGILGIDDDLVVKPFGVKGVAVSIREFTNFALNHHHGMQPEERFGWERTGVRDFDGDGVETEMTIGQVSALTLYQANLPPPFRVLPSDPKLIQAIRTGERTFREIGCAGCHVPQLPLRSGWFQEPNQYNRPGSTVPADVAGVLIIPLEMGDGTGVYKGKDGQVYVSAFTDLKRHRICDDDDPFFCNERRSQDFVPTDEFLTAKLWDCGSSAPYGHRGDLTTVSEAIIHHSAEGKVARNAFLQLTDHEKRAVIAFLLSFKVKKETSNLLVNFSKEKSK
jgi:hypothetical protein